MALVTCSDCGREVSDRAKACPNCGAPMQEDEAGQAGPKGPEVHKVLVVDPSYQGGYEAGYGCMTLFTSKPMAYIAFIVTWIFGGTYLADRRGLLDNGNDIPLWVGLAILVLPFFLAYVLRKPIQKVVPVILGSGCFILALIPALILTLWVVGGFLDLIF
jgi:hypothetical protein